MLSQVFFSIVPHREWIPWRRGCAWRTRTARESDAKRSRSDP